MKIFAAIVAIGVSVAPGASAQERPGAVYAAGGIVMFSQEGLSGLTEGQTYVTAPGGTTVGWSAGAGVFATSWLSAEATFATTGNMTAREPSRYEMTFNEERRDRFFWGAARFHVAIREGADLEPVVAFGIVSTRTTSQTEYAKPPGVPGATEIGPKLTDTVPARPLFAFGCDLRIGGRHLAIVPSFRVMRAGAYPEFPTYYPGGVSRTTISGGAALRATF